MKEFVFKFEDSNGVHVGRQEGADENAAFEELKNTYPDAEKLEAFPVDDTLAKILDAIKIADNRDAADKEQEEQVAKADVLQQFKQQIAQQRRQTIADGIAKKTLDAGEMEQGDWNQILASMTPEEKAELYEQFMEDAAKNGDPKSAEIEKKFIKYIFGVKEKGKWNQDNMTLRDLASMLNISHVRVSAIQKSALRKVINNIAKMKHYPFKISTAEEAIALLLADNIANPEELKLKAKVNGGMSFEDALKKMVKMEKAQKAMQAAKKKADDKQYRKAMKEFKDLERETNKLRDQLGLPRQYEKFFQFFAGQKMGNWA